MLDPGHEIQITKVKAHTSTAACGGCPLLLWKRGGNAIADSGAKAGAALHELSDEFLEVGVKLRQKQITVAVVPPSAASILVFGGGHFVSTPRT